MKRLERYLLIIIFIPVFLFAFEPIPRIIEGISFNTNPEKISELVNLRVVSSNINIPKGEYFFKFDNGKNEIITYHSKYNKIFKIVRYIGIYDRINYHFKVRDFITCFKRRYGPPNSENIQTPVNMPEFYFFRILHWEDSEIIMRLKTLFFAGEPLHKYWPAREGKDIIIEYINKKNKNLIYFLDFNLDTSNPCENVR